MEGFVIKLNLSYFFYKLIYKFREIFMNISGEEVLSSIISPHQVREGDLLYIGIGIGLSGGALCAAIIAHYKYIKRKRDKGINYVRNDKDDTTDIKAIIDYFDTKQPIQVI